MQKNTLDAALVLRILGGMDYTEQIRADLIADIEATAAALGFAPSTVARKAGHNGQFYRGLVEGKVNFTVTKADKLRKALEVLRNAK